MSVAAVTEADLQRVIEYFVKGGGREDVELREMQARCTELFQRDYECKVIGNEDGGLCAHYPLQIIVPESEITCSAGSLGSAGPAASAALPPTHLAELFADARFARTRSRFAVPVILHRGKTICRSATLARQMEIQAREAQDLLNTSITGLRSAVEASSWQSRRRSRAGSSSTSEPSIPATVGFEQREREGRNIVALYRNSDIELLRGLGVRYICDLMVEDRKVKYGFQVTSSEKVDKAGRYHSQFDLVSMPYPGCELFREFRDHSYCAASVQYDWSSVEVNARLNIPAKHSCALGIDWRMYQSWNLVKITQNYMLLLTDLLRSGDEHDCGQSGGVLIHCISGWDRTPLFVSLLRMSLWADGELHQSLSAVELLYLTLAYDWLLFGHALPDRLHKGEEIMLFCFHFLKFITSDKYSFDNFDLSRSTDSNVQDIHSDSVINDVSSELVSRALAAATLAVCKQGPRWSPETNTSQESQNNSTQECKEEDALFCETGNSLHCPTHSVPQSQPIDITSVVVVNRAGHTESYGSDGSPRSISGSWSILSNSSHKTPLSHENSPSARQANVQHKSPLSSARVAKREEPQPPCVDDVFDASCELLLDLSSVNDSIDSDGDENSIESDFAANSHASGNEYQCEFDCQCSACEVLAESKGDNGALKKRSVRLNGLRNIFLPMYGRCAPRRGSEASWAWMVNWAT